MTNLYRSRLNYSYAVVKMQTGGDPLHPSSRSSCPLFQACFRVVIEVGLDVLYPSSSLPLSLSGLLLFGFRILFRVHRTLKTIQTKR